MKISDAIRHVRKVRACFAWVAITEVDGTYFEITKAELKFRLERQLRDHGDLIIFAHYEDDSLYIN